MMLLGNLAIEVAKHKACMIQNYDGDVTVYTGQGSERKSLSCGIDDNENINKIIVYLNSEIELKQEVKR